MKKLLTLGFLSLIIFSPALDAGKKKGGGKHKARRQKKQKVKSDLMREQQLIKDREEKNLRHENLKRMMRKVAKKKNPRGKNKQKRGKGDEGNGGGIISARKMIDAKFKDSPNVKFLVEMIIDQCNLNSKEDKALVREYIWDRFRTEIPRLKNGKLDPCDTNFSVDSLEFVEQSKETFGSEFGYDFCERLGRWSMHLHNDLSDPEKRKRILAGKK